MLSCNVSIERLHKFKMLAYSNCISNVQLGKWELTGTGFQLQKFDAAKIITRVVQYYQ